MHREENLKMGFLNKKKIRDTPVSTLSESEIQKKLYGEFHAGDADVAVGEREHFKTSGISPSGSKENQKSRDEKEVSKTAPDLFNTSQEILSHMESVPKKPIPESKITESLLQPVTSQSHEKRSAPIESGVSSDNSKRFSLLGSAAKKQREWRISSKGFLEKNLGFLKGFSHASRLVSTKVLYGVGAIVVVFLLFWGVSVLNSQREGAMRDRYKLPKTTNKVETIQSSNSVIPAESFEAVPPVKNAMPREVVITPAAVQHSVAAKTVTAETNLNGPYVIQVVTYPSEEDARQVIEALKRENFNAFFKENKRPSGRIFYVVMIGRFRTEAEAQAQLLKFRAKEIARPFQDAFVKSIT